MLSETRSVPITFEGRQVHKHLLLVSRQKNCPSADEIEHLLNYYTYPEYGAQKKYSYPLENFCEGRGTHTTGISLFSTEGLCCFLSGLLEPTPELCLLFALVGVYGFFGCLATSWPIGMFGRWKLHPPPPPLGSSSGALLQGRHTLFQRQRQLRVGKGCTSSAAIPVLFPVCSLLSSLTEGHALLQHGGFLFFLP